MAAAGPLPAEFATGLSRLLAPGEAEAVAAVLAASVDLDDVRLASFLRSVARRVRTSPEPLTGAELAVLLSDGQGS